MPYDASDARRFIKAVAVITAALPAKPKYYIGTFGCQQNEADSERLAGMTEAMGYERTSDAGSASLIIYNTCAVREHAEKKALSLIGQLKHKKAANPDLLVGVCGCMTAQEHRMSELRNRYPYVDFLFGTKFPERYPEILYNALVTRKRVFCSDEGPADGGRGGAVPPEGLPVRREGGSGAWLSIMYGCDNFCTYCIVPYVRGRERSREPQAVLDEARALVASGCREITLLGQNVNSYAYGFARLLSELDKIPGEYLIRFMTSHPKDATRELIDAIAASKHVARHFHLPLQSGSDRVLAAMNRRYTREHYLELIAYMRSKMPDIAISTDIIVGFPDETEEDFADTLDMLERVRYDFAYSVHLFPPAGYARGGVGGAGGGRGKKRAFFHGCLSCRTVYRWRKIANLSEKPSAYWSRDAVRTIPIFLPVRSERCRLVHFPDGDGLVCGKIRRSRYNFSRPPLR